MNKLVRLRMISKSIKEWKKIKILRLYLVPWKFEGKCKGKKIEKKDGKKIKNKVKVNKLFYMLFQTHLTYFN